jgi:hypothetical protein
LILKRIEDSKSEVVKLKFNFLVQAWEKRK